MGWYNDLDIDLTIQQKTFTIQVPKTNKLSELDWARITKYVQSIFSIKTLVDGIKSLEYNEISNSELLAWRYYYSKEYENAIFILRICFEITQRMGLFWKDYCKVNT